MHRFEQEQFKEQNQRWRFNPWITLEQRITDNWCQLRFFGQLYNNIISVDVTSPSNQHFESQGCILCPIHVDEKRIRSPSNKIIFCSWCKSCDAAYIKQINLISFGARKESDIITTLEKCECSALLTLTRFQLFHVPWKIRIWCNITDMNVLTFNGLNGSGLGVSCVSGRRIDFNCGSFFTSAMHGFSGDKEWRRSCPGSDMTMKMMTMM